MALLEANWRPASKELRWFAVGFAVIVGGLAGMQAVRTQSPVVGVLSAMAVLAGAAGAVKPELIRPVYLIWMLAAYPIGWTVSHTILIATYFLVVTPIGLVLRALGRDPMERRFEPGQSSYWVKREQVSDRSRYLQQF